MSLCGCFIAIENNRCLLFIYTFFLMITFSLEITIGMLALIFKERIFSSSKQPSNDQFIKLLRNEYGFHSQYTAAIDLAQTKFECCGIISSNDYRQSRWLQKQLDDQFANNFNDQNILSVSRTCCRLSNRRQKNSYLNPHPINETKCQSTNDEENRTFRNQKGCLQFVDEFIRTECKMFILLGVGLAAFSFLGILISVNFCRSVHTKPRLMRQQPTRKAHPINGHSF